jgi:hypothetical protein
MSGYVFSRKLLHSSHSVSKASRRVGTPPRRSFINAAQQTLSTCMEQDHGADVDSACSSYLRLVRFIHMPRLILAGCLCWLLFSVNKSLAGKWASLACHETGSLVVQTAFEQCEEADKELIIGELLDEEAFAEVVTNAWGAFCIVHRVSLWHIRIPRMLTVLSGSQFLNTDLPSIVPSRSRTLSTGLVNTRRTNRASSLSSRRLRKAVPRCWTGS